MADAVAAADEGAGNSLVRGLEHLIDIGVALSAEQDIERLLHTILDAAMAVTQADGGTLYQVCGQRQLQFRILINHSLGLRLGAPDGQGVPLPDIPLYEADGSPNRRMVSAYAAVTGRTVNIRDAYSEAGFDFSGTRDFDARTGYRSQSFLTVPLRSHEGEVIGVLQLINALDPPSRAPRPFSEQDQRLVEALASQAAVALTNRLLIDQLAKLFESFVDVINQAIDEKSPHTGQHCRRIPELTIMIAEAVHEADSGPLADFRLTDQDRYELKIAAMLHDCGKVTTPAHVVEKSTKLQTITDRVHLIDTRIEILRRDAEIAWLRARIAALEQGHAQGLEAAREMYAETLAQLAEDRHFLHRCNIGSETMCADDQARVGHIAAYPWRDQEGRAQRLLSADEELNLKIAKGTLTAAERELINHHIVATINMLEALPWPRHLRNVPEYAGGHHERMDGKGYPKGLTGEQMSVQARIMAVADIFEALTSADRPYKRANTLSEALTIMGRMKLERHIDPDIFDLFVARRVYLRYAEQYLNPAQIDAVDVSRLPGYSL